MNILITGSKGFIGRNLVKLLKKDNPTDVIMEFDKENTLDELAGFCEKADVVFHLAAVVRPNTAEEYINNVDLTSTLLDFIKKNNRKCSIMFSSSIQADLDNPYGQSKRIEEQTIINYGKKNGINTYIFRFPNLFGPMSRPNYTSVVATFCYNTIKGLPITVNNPSLQMKFAYVLDVVDQVTKIVLSNKKTDANRIITIDRYYTVGLGEIAYYMECLKINKKSAILRNDDFYQKLKSVYEWYENNYSIFD